MLATGEHRYRLKVQFRTDRLTALNAYKIATNGMLEIVPGLPGTGGTPPQGGTVTPDAVAEPATPEIIGGFIGGVVDSLNLDNVPTVQGNRSVARDPYPDVLTPPPEQQLPTSYGAHWRNDYVGTIDVRLRLEPPPGESFSAYLHRVVLTNADLDDREDLQAMDESGAMIPHTPRPGLPADQGGPYTAPRNPAPGEPYIQYDTSGFALPTSPVPGSPSPNGNPYLEIYAPGRMPPNPPIRVCTDLSGTADASGQGFERIPIPGDQPPGVWLLRFKQVDARNSIFVRSQASIVAQASRVGGRVFCDANMNGNDDLGTDMGIGGAGITIQRLDVVNGTTVTTTSSADGRWRVGPIPGGRYRVTVASNQPPLAGLPPTTPVVREVTVPEGEDVGGVDFGFGCLVRGKVFCDANANGAVDAEDAGIAGAVVRLTPVSGGASQTQTCDANGEFAFSGATAGPYDVTADTSVPPLAGKTPTSPTTVRISGPSDAKLPLRFGFRCPCDCAHGSSFTKVGLEAELWLGSCSTCVDVDVELHAGCPESETCPETPLVDRASFSWCRPATAGPWRGANGVLEVQEAVLDAGILYVRFTMTATGSAFPNGMFEGDWFVKANARGRDFRAGCGAFDCTNAAVGKRWPQCPSSDPGCYAAFRVTSVATGACLPQTPPPPPPPSCGCVRNACWWRDHSACTKQPWPTPCSESTKTCGRTWSCVLESSVRCDRWTRLAQQWIAASLNRCAGACANADVVAKMDDAKRLLESSCGSCRPIDAKRADCLADALESWNAGQGDAPACVDRATAAKPAKCRK